MFLRFGEERRLAEVLEVSSGNFGSREPHSFFPQREPGDECLEVHPAVLQKLRPIIFYELAGHCVLVKEGLKVDQVGAIRARLTLRQKAQLETDLVRRACELSTLLGASSILGEDFPSSASSEMTIKRDKLQQVKDQIAVLSDQFPEVPEPLQELSGKCVPL